jgi:hypothetical protein
MHADASTAANTPRRSCSPLTDTRLLSVAFSPVSPQPWCLTEQTITCGLPTLQRDSARWPPLLPGSVPVVWGAVLVMALAAMVDPLRIGITVLVVSRERPMLQLLAFWLGGVAMGLTVGLGALFLLRDLALQFMQHATTTTASAGVAITQIVLGVLALIIATLIAVGFRRRTNVRQLTAPPALSRLWERGGSSPWIAFLLGAWLGTPLQYIAALAAILASGADAGTQVGAVILYQVVVLALAEIPLVSGLFAPVKTQVIMSRVHDWVAVRRRQLVAVIIAVVGIFLMLNGIRSL